MPPFPRDEGGAAAAAAEAPVDAARALVGEWRVEPEPWQGADETVDRLAARTPALGEATLRQYELVKRP